MYCSIRCAIDAASSKRKKRQRTGEALIAFEALESLPTYALIEIDALENP